MKRILTNEQILKIGRTYGRSHGPSELSQEMGVSKQRIQQVAYKLKELGVPIPRLKNYSALADQLKQELNGKNN